MTDTVFRLPPWRRTSPVLLSLSPQERDWAVRQFKIPDIWQHTRGTAVRHNPLPHRHLQLFSKKWPAAEDCASFWAAPCARFGLHE